MSTPTAGIREPLVPVDVSELTVPQYLDDMFIVIKAVSPAQLKFATQVRNKKMEEWQSDLPNSVWQALKGINDPGWWLANQHKDVANIGWPQSWVGPKRNQAQPELGQPPLLQENRDRSAAETGALLPVQDIEEFDQFARKACQSPELAYLTMMAFLYRQTKDERVKAKFQTVRERIDAHLDAIDKIADL
jgi:hypothetical protein